MTNSNNSNKEEVVNENESNIKEENITDNTQQTEQTQEIDELSMLQNKLKESEDKYLRLLAELENSRRRSYKAQEDASKYAIVDFSKEIITSIDIFTKAFQSIKDYKIEDDLLKNFVVGIELTKKELEKSLSKFNVEKISPLGSSFDSNYHEALFSKEDKTKEDGIVFEVIEDGYKIYDRLLRPAKVGIIKNNN